MHPTHTDGYNATVSAAVGVVAAYRPGNVETDESSAADRDAMNKPSNAESDRYRERQRKEKQHSTHLPGADDEPLPPPVEPIVTQDKPNRNDPCLCGSGKKYKKCCGMT